MLSSDLNTNVNFSMFKFSDKLNKNYTTFYIGRRNHLQRLVLTLRQMCSRDPSLDGGLEHSAKWSTHERTRLSFAHTPRCRLMKAQAQNLGPFMPSDQKPPSQDLKAVLAPELRCSLYRSVPPQIRYSAHFGKGKAHTDKRLECHC